MEMQIHSTIKIISHQYKEFVRFYQTMRKHQIKIKITTKITIFDTITSINIKKIWLLQEKKLTLHIFVF